MGTCSRLLVTVLVGVGGLVGCSAGGGGSVCRSRTVTVTSPAAASVRPGDSVALAGANFLPCHDQGEGRPTAGDQDITLSLVGATTTVLGVVDAQPDGSWTVTVVVPDVAPGAYEIRTPAPDALPVAIAVT